MIRLGIVGCSEIAFRRFMPAAAQIKDLKVVAVAEEYDVSKLETFCSTYNLEGEESFTTLIDRTDIDAVYIPQPPALHYKWAKYALEHGKHVLVEKPFTISFNQTNELVELAKSRNLALHENYMFTYHSQISSIKNMVDDGEVGAVRLIRADFGFPMRAQNDFRYNKALGGGALLDAGGYAVKLATIFLGKSVCVKTSQLNYEPDFEVDMYGSATLSNDEGTVCQIGFGMDCSYRCSLEVWGSKGRLFTNRVFTAPDGYEPVVLIENADGTREVKLSADSHFEHSIEAFINEIEDSDARMSMYEDILLQSRLVGEFI